MDCSTNVICAPRSTYSSGRIAASMPMPTKLNDPRAMNVSAVAGFEIEKSSCGKNRTSAMKITAVWMKP